GSSGIIPFPRV
uniref:Periviscerokinin-3 n=1 Tax=Aptera fusca TaxID=344696 RepID=PVK3_APTFU|nr:RecName: Full=Periviscerokinin-3; Short=AptFu-PVK-3 [Aptera fusca]